MFDLNSYLVSKSNYINNSLNEILRDRLSSSRIVSAMKYSLMAGGKRIRPVLCIAATEAVGGKADDVLPAACAIEMIHTYSLIHDDLPAIDNDGFRRGKPTCHIAFDEATAILAGDALLTLAFQILSSIELKNEHYALKWLSVVHAISRAAGYQEMIEGQMRDISSEGIMLTLNELEEMHSLKTGAIIEASIYCGAIIGNGGIEQMRQLEIYAKNIGLAFQVTDDILNVEGDPKIMGKAVGTDKNRKKSTYPSIMGINKSREFAEKLAGNALQSLDGFDNRSDPLRAIAGYIIKRKR
ncbi:MAG: polyprenyl synthetase family protein [Desulfobacteraceae bacterium]|uniref:Polyprenyl synthetase family protein n=1 Tax=Candidatus Desulfaltia bathyphila TaxID=2841697 RepID=A0A8J6N6R5_9BACT|nr:polyprenyl synthetase family protein [Candidatus Desulfaltia bathyphila]MBL7195353.1 polyprenyl synthetase family protein [Desulfobacterales bacterium]